VRAAEVFKAIFLLAAISLLHACSSLPHSAETLGGRWEGVVDISGTKSAIVDFTEDPNGSLSATLDVPDERLLGKPLTNVRYDPPKVHFELQATERKITFEGTRKGEVISGIISGGEISGPLSLRHTGSVPATPYAQEEVRFRNGDVTLSGTLLIPPTKRRHPDTALFRLGRIEEANNLIDKFLKDYPKDEGGGVTSVKAMMLAKAGRTKEAEDAIQRAIEIGTGFGHFHHTAYNIASAYALMNQPEPAVKWLQVAADDGLPCYPLFAQDANLDSLRKDEHFIAFMAKLKQQWEHYQATL
jgi:tetratricopeptide (TPR) repeat protein